MNPALLFRTGSRRRRFLIMLLAALNLWACHAEEGRWNVLFITVDDMNWDSAGVYGCPIPGITPNIDRLAAEGMRFHHAHVNIAICQPTRAVWMTGRYSHRNGAVGFNAIAPEVPTLPEALKEAGYYTGLMAKHGHVVPTRHFAFDEIVPAKALMNGRSPEHYYRATLQFMKSAREKQRPFFLMANAQDPHRPFVGSQQEANARKRDKTNRTHQYGGGFPEDAVLYRPTEVPVPGFLPDLPDIRKELAQYYTSVHRADATVGAVLKALDDAGYRDNTMVVFMSDHGMPLPFAKTNAYLHSTKTPWIVRWPGVVEAGASDSKHFISGIDFAPTVFEACRLEPFAGMDGRSIVPLLKGMAQSNRESVFTQIHITAAKNEYPIRSVQNETHGLIYNAWSDGSTAFKNESQSGLTFRAMRQAAEDDAEVAARVRHFLHRTPEELYNYKTDPDALNNLTGRPELQEIQKALRERLLTVMRQSGDPLTQQFERYLNEHPLN